MNQVQVTKPVKQPIDQKKSIVRVKLFHLDGSESEMRLQTPFYTSLTEPLEMASVSISNYIESLTARFIQIRSYQVSFGTVNQKGEEVLPFNYPEVEIPVNKVYYRGKWVNPNKVKTSTSAI